MLAGVRRFSTDAYLYEEKVEGNRSEMVYNVTFSVGDATIPSAVSYYVIFEKQGGKKKFKFMEVIK